MKFLNIVPLFYVDSISLLDLIHLSLLFVGLEYDYVPLIYFDYSNKTVINIFFHSL